MPFEKLRVTIRIMSCSVCRDSGSSADSKLILLKLARMERQQLHRTQVPQCIMEVLQSTDESGDIPAYLGLPRALEK